MSDAEWSAVTSDLQRYRVATGLARRRPGVRRPAGPWRPSRPGVAAVAVCLVAFVLVAGVVVPGPVTVRAMAASVAPLLAGFILALAFGTRHHLGGSGLSGLVVRAMRRRGRCPSCGYALVGGACPECGAVWAPPAAAGCQPVKG